MDSMDTGTSLRSRPACRPLPEEFRQAAGLVERRWAIAVVYASSGGATRFADFRDALGQVPPATLVARLNELVSEGVLERRPAGRRVEYRLTEAGRALAAIVSALERWGRTR